MNVRCENMRHIVLPEELGQLACCAFGERVPVISAPWIIEGQMREDQSLFTVLRSTQFLFKPTSLLQVDHVSVEVINDDEARSSYLKRIVKGAKNHGIETAPVVF